MSLIVASSDGLKIRYCLIVDLVDLFETGYQEASPDSCQCAVTASGSSSQSEKATYVRLFVGSFVDVDYDSYGDKCGCLLDARKTNRFQPIDWSNFEFRGSRRQGCGCISAH